MDVRETKTADEAKGTYLARARKLPSAAVSSREITYPLTPSHYGKENYSHPQPAFRRKGNRSGRADIPSGSIFWERRISEMSDPGHAQNWVICLFEVCQPNETAWREGGFVQ